jgi:transcriptional regulator with XRE-family HTH domain
MTFGTLLRHWRTARGLSQLRLAMEAGISARHLSFLETGRAHPSREMVHLLTGMLQVPTADRNALLIAGGYAPTYEHETGPSLAAPEHVQRALDAILRQQEPYPALVLDAELNVTDRNAAARHIFDIFYDSPRDCAPINVVSTVFDPNGLRPFIVNLESVARSVLSGGAGCDSPLVNLELRRGDVSLTFFSTMTAVAGVRVKSFFPADTATEQFARRIAALPAA